MPEIVLSTGSAGEGPKGEASIAADIPEQKSSDEKELKAKNTVEKASDSMPKMALTPSEAKAQQEKLQRAKKSAQAVEVKSSKGCLIWLIVIALILVAGFAGVIFLINNSFINIENIFDSIKNIFSK